MATHEELSVLRDARLGHLSAQLDLGRRYLQGSHGLPKNLEAALHWLNCAAQQNSLDACVLIGRHIPYDIARLASNMPGAIRCYERAFEAGETEAGVVFAKLVLQRVDSPLPSSLRENALAALRSAAHSGSHEAQWMWAKYVGDNDGCRELSLIWTSRAAKGGVVAAQYVMAEHAWQSGDKAAFLEWSLPLARDLQQFALRWQKQGDISPPMFSSEHLTLLQRCGQVLLEQSDANVGDVQTFWEIAATGGAIDAQCSLGLLLAGMRMDGEKDFVESRQIDYAKAIHWLTLAGDQGLKEAWFVLSRIHERRFFSGKDLDLARHYRHRAAEMGHCQAQYECGVSAWDCRNVKSTNESRAIYWLELAEAQGCVAASEMLAHIRKASAHDSHDDSNMRLRVADTGERILFVA